MLATRPNPETVLGALRLNVHPAETLDIDVYARVALLRAYEKEHRLLATVDQMVQRMRLRADGSATSSRG